MPAEENELGRLFSSLAKSDSRVSEIFLGVSRGDSAFMRVSPFEDLGFSKAWSGFGCGSGGRPPTVQSDCVRLASPVQTIEEPIDSVNKKAEDLRQDHESEIKDLVKRTYFNKQSGKTRKKRKVEEE